MEINIQQQEQAVVIEIVGQLNSTTTPQVQEHVLSVARSGQCILLDMSGVTYLSSAGLRLLLLVYRRVREHEGLMVLTGLREEVQDVMNITGFLDLFSTFENRQAGLQALRKAS